MLLLASPKSSKLRITASCTSSLCRNASSSISSVDPFDRFQRVRQIVDQAQPVLAHTGMACASTVARKLSGSAFGVSTSTDTPSSCKSSCRIAPTREAWFPASGRRAGPGRYPRYRSLEARPQISAGWRRDGLPRSCASFPGVPVRRLTVSCGRTAWLRLERLHHCGYIVDAAPSEAAASLAKTNPLWICSQPAISLARRLCTLSAAWRHTGARRHCGAGHPESIGAPFFVGSQ